MLDADVSDPKIDAMNDWWSRVEAGRLYSVEMHRR
jgi:hypothetical protein